MIGSAGLGSMRVQSGAVLDAAIAAGVDLIDTADAYATEALVGAAVARAGRPVAIVTKGGLVRPGGGWANDGRASHLAAAARASRDRLGVAPDLYLLHAIDPRVPLATSVRALARLRDEGVVRAIGLSNVNRAQLDEALAIAPIEAIELELGPWKLDALRGGLVAWCAERGLRVLAHRPLGGAAGVKRLARDARLVELADAHAITPAELATAWLCAKGVVPLPGATRIETAVSAARAQRIALDRDVVARIDRIVGLEAHAPPVAHAAARADREVVLILGMPAAGKTTLAADYVARGYVRLNRDERGGSLADLAHALDHELARGAAGVVLDNTYPTRAARAPVIAIARRHGARIRCVVVATSLEDAQTHACARMIVRHGRLLAPDEIKRASRRDPGTFAPGAQFRWRREHEPPALDEGWDAIDEHVPPRAATTGAPALIVTLEEHVWLDRPTGAGDVRLRDGAAAALAAHHARGHVLAGIAWLPDVGDDAWAAIADRTRALVGAPIHLARCAHGAGPPVCWCRKPLPGLGVALAHAHGLDLARSILVGRGAADRGFAQRLGLAYVEAWP